MTNDDKMDWETTWRFRSLMIQQLSKIRRERGISARALSIELGLPFQH